METLFIYIAKSAGLLLLFYCAYYFLLRKETFFNSNRYFLLAGLVTAAALPLVIYTKIIWVQPTPLSNSNLQDVFPQNVEQKSFEINWLYVILGIYIIGLLVLLLKFALDFYNLNSILKGKKVQQQADFKFVDINENIAPFSYFDYIVYNSSLYTASELENIIEHEKVHSDQNHTLDVLISRIFCIIFWFNPISWLYKKAITQNLEFIADSEAAKSLSDKKAYQYTLLKITTHENCAAITNHFYQSLIKKRIVMLNKNQSKKSNSWKYYTVIPALAAFVLLFQVEVIAREKKQAGKETTTEKIKSVEVYKINKNSTDKELKEFAEKLKSDHNLDVVISDVNRNSDNELTSIKIDIKNGDKQAQAMQIGSNKPISDYGIIITTDDNGTKKIDFNAGDNLSESAPIVKQKVTIKKTQKINTDTNVKVNDNTNTNKVSNADHNVNTNVNTIVSTSINTDGNKKEVTTVSYNSNGQPKVVIKSNKTMPQLIIVDGVVMPNDITMDELDALDISSMNVINGTQATSKYGEEGKNGVIVITTKK